MFLAIFSSLLHRIVLNNPSRLYPEENFPFQHYGHPYLASEHIPSDMGHMMRARFITSVDLSYQRRRNVELLLNLFSLWEAPHYQMVAWRGLSMKCQMTESMHVESWSNVPFSHSET